MPRRSRRERRAEQRERTEIAISAIDMESLTRMMNESVREYADEVYPISPAGRRLLHALPDLRLDEESREALADPAANIRDYYQGRLPENVSVPREDPIEFYDESNSYSWFLATCTLCAGTVDPQKEVYVTDQQNAHHMSCYLKKLAQDGVIVFTQADSPTEDANPKRRIVL